MNKDSRVRDAQNRIKAIFEKRPQQALSTNHATAVIKGSLTCKFTEGDHSAVMDMPEIMGGDAAAQRYFPLWMLKYILRYVRCFSVSGLEAL